MSTDVVRICHDHPLVSTPPSCHIEGTQFTLSLGLALPLTAVYLYKTVTRCSGSRASAAYAVWLAWHYAVYVPVLHALMVGFGGARY